MSKYPQYKKCDGDWITQIPVDWDIVRGKYLFDIKKRIAGELGHKVLSITQKGIKVKDTESGEGQLSMDYSKYQIVEPGDFAMNHMDLLTGYVDISEFNGVTSPDYRVFATKEKTNCSRFFLYVLQMGYTQKIFFKYGQGASHLGRWRLPTDGFNNFFFPCPPNSVRQQIVDYLDHEVGKIDDLINKQQELLNLLQERLKVSIGQIVTKGLDDSTDMQESGVDWIDKVPSHWKILRLSFALKLQSGDSITSAKIKSEGEYLVYGGNGIRGYADNYNCDGQYVLIGRQGALCGNINIAKGQFFASEHAVVVYPIKKFNVIYLAELLRFMDLGQYSMSAAQPGISVERVNLLKLIMPPENEQNEIAKLILKEKSKNNSLSQECKDIIQLLQHRRSALIYSAVTGKIDVTNFNINKDSNNKVY